MSVHTIVNPTISESGLDLFNPGGYGSVVLFADNLGVSGQVNVYIIGSDGVARAYFVDGAPLMLTESQPFAILPTGATYATEKSESPDPCGIYWAAATDTVIAAATAAAGAAFDPMSLFTSGEQGAWYDPSDLSTMFQDAFGATPVTDVEQPVALILDKRKAVEELPTIGWAINSGDGVVTVVDNTVTITGATTTTRVDIAASGWSANDFGYITINASVAGATSPLIYSGSSPLPINEGTATYAQRLQVSGLCRLQIGSGSATFTITSRSRRVGNHAAQLTTANRPVLSARVNRIPDTRMSALVAIAGTNNATAATGPTGLTDAYKLQENGATATTHTYGGGSLTGAGAVGSQQVYSVVAKAAERSWLFINTSDGVTGLGGYFDLVNGVVGTIDAGLTASITAFPGAAGWWICSLSRTVAGTSGNISYLIAQSNGGVTYDGVTGSGIIIAYPQVETGTARGPYQYVNSSSDYDTVGFNKYLKFDGVDDGLSTPATVDLTATDKATAFVGVRVIGTGNQGAVYFGNGLAGSFDLLFMAGAAPRLRGRLAGSGASSVSISGTTADTVAAVYTASFDIAGATASDETKIRKNGALGVSTVELPGPAGTGNFGTYSVTIGQIAGVLLLSGRIYQLIILGAAASAPNIDLTEAYVNAKTGAY